MKCIYITGLSGTGKSSVIAALRARGFRAVDTDEPGWTERLNTGDGPEWLLHEERLRALLQEPRGGPLFVSGCCANQGKFRLYFDVIVLLSAPLAVIRERVLSRTTTPYGKTPAEWAEITANYEYAQPLLQRSADVELDTCRMTVAEIAEYLAEMAFQAF